MTPKAPTQLSLDEITLKIIRLSQNGGNKECFSEDSSNMNWDGFLEKSFQEGISGLVYYNLKNYPHNLEIPPEYLIKLKEEYNINVGRNIFISGELKEIYSAFENKKIDVVFVRGAVFFNKIYPAIGIRPLVDADLVIFEKDFEAVKSVLLTLNYKFTKNCPFFFEKDNFYLDLHLNIPGFWRAQAENSSIDIRQRQVWQQTCPIDKNFSYVRSLGRYDSILAASQHLQWHNFDRLIWFVDIANLVNSAKSSLNWNDLISRAKKFNLKKTLYFVVKYLDQHKLINIEPWELEGLYDLSLNNFERKSSLLILANKRGNISGELLFLFSIKGLKRKVSFILDVIFLGKERIPESVDKKGFWVYFKRFFRILFKTFIKSLTTLKPVS